jgi:hypothetical protein
MGETPKRGQGNTRRVFEHFDFPSREQVLHRVQVCVTRDQDLPLCAVARYRVFDRPRNGYRKESQRGYTTIRQIRAASRKPVAVANPSCLGR